MNLYLVRHGEAQSEGEDPSRPLSGAGARDVSRVAYFIFSNKTIEVEAIYHSGKLRAEQTAELLMEYIKSRTGLTKAEGLAPMDDPIVWAGRINGMNDDIMLVGHLPHLARLSSMLLCGSPEAHAIEFKTGGIVCLRKEGSRWSLQWAVPPEMVK